MAVSWVGHASGRYIGSDVVFFRFTRVSEYVRRGGADDEAGQISAASLAQSTVGVRSRQPTKASATFFFACCTAAHLHVDPENPSSNRSPKTSVSFCFHGDPAPRPLRLDEPRAGRLE